MLVVIKKIILFLLFVIVCQEVGLSADKFFQASAEENQTILCQLDDRNGASAGSITFNFNPLESTLGFIEYNGLFLDHEKKYYAITHKIKLLKLEHIDFEGGSYIFEGTDESIENGKVTGRFKDVNNFEVTGYFSKSYSNTDCIYYRLTPFKSDWAKRIAKENPKFRF